MSSSLCVCIWALRDVNLIEIFWPCLPRPLSRVLLLTYIFSIHHFLTVLYTVHFSIVPSSSLSLSLSILHFLRVYTAWICVSLYMCVNNTVSNMVTHLHVNFLRVNMVINGDTLIQIYNYIVQDDDEQIVAHLFWYIYIVVRWPRGIELEDWF